MVDCIIIGSGPAGISSALTLKANGKTFLLFGIPEISKKVEKAEEIRNYPALPSLTGKDFAAALKNHLKSEEITVQQEKVSGVYPTKDKFTVTTQEGNLYESRTVILACGVENIKPIDGEEAFLGRGVSYCATCDGFLYKNKTIAIICTAEGMEHEIDHLVRIAGKVYLIPLYKGEKPTDEKITTVMKLPKQITGEKRVEKLVFPPSPNIPTELPIDGVFVLRDCLSPTALVTGLQTEKGHIVVGRDMSTNIKGLFACGDCTGRPYQYAKAIGEGNIASHSVCEYLK